MKPARPEAVPRPALEGRGTGIGSPREFPCPMLILNSSVPLKELQ